MAGVDPKIGVYSAIVVTLVASIFQSSHLVTPPTSVISLLVFSSLAFIDPVHLRIGDPRLSAAVLIALGEAVPAAAAVGSNGEARHYYDLV